MAGLMDSSMAREDWAAEALMDSSSTLPASFWTLATASCMAFWTELWCSLACFCKVPTCWAVDLTASVSALTCSTAGLKVFSMALEVSLMELFMASAMTLLESCWSLARVSFTEASSCACCVEATFSSAPTWSVAFFNVLLKVSMLVPADLPRSVRVLLALSLKLLMALVKFSCTSF